MVKFIEFSRRSIIGLIAIFDQHRMQWKTLARPIRQIFAQALRRGSSHRYHRHPEYQHIFAHEPVAPLSLYRALPLPAR
ncbi:MAG: hypothetical protein V4582_13400 [Pseudomonadota bacterium]